MKKVAFIALLSFFLGILIAATIFVYFPEKNSPRSFLEEDSSPSLTSNLLASPSLQSKPDLDFVKIADKLAPAVVQITSVRVEKRRAPSMWDDFDDFWDRFFNIPRGREREKEYRSEARGTGFFISSDGYIITNHHLVSNAENVTISTSLDKEYKAEVVGSDSNTDIALLKVADKELIFADLGDSARLRVGEWVLAIGNPWGLEHTVTAGIVSAKGRQVTGSLPLQDFIQTDAAINRGNSGGPLVNMKGEVVGITSMIYSPSGGNIGIGFAIPSNLAKKVVKQLKEKGRVIRGYLGIVPQAITEADKEYFKLKSKRGALVAQVEPDTPADKAGFQQADVITEINGQPVKNDNDLRLKIAEIEPGTRAEIKIIRDGKEKILTAKISEFPTDEAEVPSASSGKELGLEYTTLTPRLARRYGFRTEEGVIITEVTRYSEADRRGVLAGDIILEANRKKVFEANDLENIIKKLKPGDTLMLVIRRERDRDSVELIKTLRIPE
ncbi:MAG: Do family serine endopeptidase [Candidatus Aminicenantes bacterium]|nr:MAG: Do family serine endopeptidase [Candidatus Aminicenantes bacterium]